MVKCNTKYITVDNNMFGHFLHDFEELICINNFTTDHIILNTDDNLIGEVDLKNVVLLVIRVVKIKSEYYLVIKFKRGVVSKISKTRHKEVSIKNSCYGTMTI